MHAMDLNCDMGEGIGQEESIFPFISSVNIACGGHAGDEDTMSKMVELAIAHGVAIGAHPSYPDREHFGRVDMLQNGIKLEDIPFFLRDQLLRLQTVCAHYGVRLHHVKLHGALYNRAARDAGVSDLVCGVIRQFDPLLILYGLSGSEMKTAARKHELAFVNEVFADRSYAENGSLTPRTEAGALIEDPAKAVEQALRMAKEGTVLSLSGKSIPVQAETICLHGDGPKAASFAQQIYESLRQEDIGLKAPVFTFL